MKKREILVFLIVFLNCFVVSAEVKPLTGEEVYSDGSTGLPKYVPGEFIVKFKQEPQFSVVTSAQGTPVVSIDIASINALNLEHNVVAVEEVTSRNSAGLFKLKTQSTEGIKTIVEEYKNDPNVENAEPHYIAHTLFTPNDPLFLEQWAHQNTEAELAWDIEQGDSNVIIAVIDTGVDYNHEDLADNIWINTGETPGNSIDDDGNGFTDDVRGYDFVSLACTDPDDCFVGLEDYGPRDADPDDYNGHGTHCSGIVAGKGNNGLGISGVCPNCKIMAVRAGYSYNHPQYGEVGGLVYHDIADAIYYAVDNGADIISMSFGGPGDQLTVKPAIEYAHQNGVILIAAAGNGDTYLPSYPAYYEEVFAVAATDVGDVRADFSNYGEWIGISAPGVSILSTYPTIRGGELLLSDLYVVSENVDVASSAMEYSATGDVEAGLVVIAGVGQDTDYDGIDVTGKIALIQRGELSFKQKVDNAYGHGAVGAIIYNNVDGSFLGTLQSASAIPAVSISKADGEYLAGLVDPIVRLTLESTSGYRFLSGTSMACPYVAGTAGLMLSNDPSLITEDILLRMMVSSDDISAENPSYIGRLGAGRVNVYNALTTTTTPGPELMVLNYRTTLPPQPDTQVGIQFTIINRGSTAENVRLSLSTAEEHVNILSPPINLGNIGFFEVVDTSFFVFFEQTAPLDVYDFVLAISSDNSDPVQFSFTLEIQELDMNWVREIDGINAKDPVIVDDINRDGRKEIIFALGGTGTGETGHGMIYVIQDDGSDMPGWPVVADLDAEKSRVSGLSVGDINDDGYSEIIITETSTDLELRAYDHLGNELIGFPVYLGLACTTFGLAHSLVEDMNGDGVLDIIIRYRLGCGRTSGNFIEVYDHQGQNLYSIELESGQNHGYYISSCDIDGDRGLEIIYGKVRGTDLQPGGIYVFENTGTQAQGWPAGTTRSYGRAPTNVADLDNDGDLEVIGHDVSWPSGGLGVFDHTGNQLFFQQLDECGFWGNSEPIPADLDADGDLEVIIVDYRGSVAAYHHDGSLVSGWPVYPDSHIYGGSYSDTVLFYPRTIAADIDSDGYSEVLLMTYSEENAELPSTDWNQAWINAWNHDGTPVNGFPKKYPHSYLGYTRQSLTVADLDGNGLTDIITLAGRDYYGFERTAYVGRLELDTTFNGADWPMYRHDPQRTGNHGFKSCCHPADANNCNGHIVLGELVTYTKAWIDGVTFDSCLNEEVTIDVADAYYVIEWWSQSSECADSDFGVDYYTAGSACLGDSCNMDECSISIAGHEQVREYYCEVGEILSTEARCLSGCENGACVKSIEPYCGGIGTVSQGWYTPSGDLIKSSVCEGGVAECRFIGTTDHGWYSSKDGTLIELGDCESACWYSPYCLNNQYCDFTPCNVETGTCIDIPKLCSPSDRPVCGCDGTTYDNDCNRKLAQVGKDYDGEC